MTEIAIAPFGVTLPPSQFELPDSDGEPMETQRHKDQMDILIDSLWLWLETQRSGYVGGNMFVYFSMAQVRNQDFKGPDFFAVTGVPKGERRSWVVWEEGKGPDVVIELLSPSTAAVDKEEKKRIYEQQLRVPEYYWYDPFNPEDWAGFVLRQGQYEAMSLTRGDRFISEALGLALVRWEGSYRGTVNSWLRWATMEGTLLPIPQELADQAQAQAQQAQAQVNQLTQQLQDCAIALLKAGTPAAQVAAMTGLTLAEVEALTP